MMKITSQYANTFPIPLAASIQKYLQEERVYSADELSAMIEVVLKHIGWLWIIEYTSQTNHDEDVDLLLYQSFLTARRNPSVGSWAYISSQISKAFHKHGWSTFCLPLLSLHYGKPDDTTTPLSRLLHFRNHFAHGSFEAIVDDICEHEHLLFEFLQPLQAFQHHPILFWSEARDMWCVADGQLSSYSESLSLPSKDCYLLNDEGKELLLSPAIQVKEEKEGNFLSYLSIAKTSHDEKKDFLQRNPLSVASIEKLERRKRGHLSFEHIFSGSDEPNLTKEQVEEINTQIWEEFATEKPERPSIVLLQSYPGAGKSSFFKHARDSFPNHQVYVLYQIKKEDLTASAVTFCRYFVMEVTKALPLNGWEEKLDETTNAVELFYETLALLQEREYRVFLGIDDFHRAFLPYLYERQSILDVIANIQQISGKYLNILLSARHGFQEGLVRDVLIDLPIEVFKQKETYEEYMKDLHLSEELLVSPLSQEERYFRRQLLFILANTAKALSTFELCVAFERLLEQKKRIPIESPIFTPRVERALWDLRSVLKEYYFDTGEQHIGQSKIKKVKLYCPHFAQWIRQHHYF